MAAVLIALSIFSIRYTTLVLIIFPFLSIFLYSSYQALIPYRITKKTQALAAVTMLYRRDPLVILLRYLRKFAIFNAFIDYVFIYTLRLSLESRINPSY